MSIIRRRYTVILAALLATVAGFLIATKNHEPESIDGLSLNGDEHVYGDNSAPIKIIVYSEMECPFCKELHPHLIRLIHEGDGKRALIFRHFPLPSHPKSFIEAKALECMNSMKGTEAFWSFIDKLFIATPSNNDIDLSLLPVLASEFGVSQSDFQNCIDSSTYESRIQRDIESGLALNVDSVPQVFIMVGKDKVLTFRKVPNYDVLKKTIEAAGANVR